MIGTWIGSYTYLSKRLPEAVRNQETKFKITIDKFDGENFSGTVEDDNETGGMKGIGKIVGKKLDTRIKFVKMMPNQTVYLPDGRKFEENTPHRKVYYSGVLKDDTVCGVWKFKFGFGKVNNRTAIFPSSKGEWKMKKSSTKESI